MSGVNIDLLFKIAGIGIFIGFKYSAETGGKQEQAQMLTLVGW